MDAEHIDQDDLAGMLPSEIVEMVNTVLDSEARLRGQLAAERSARAALVEERDQAIDAAHWLTIKRGELIDALTLYCEAQDSPDLHVARDMMERFRISARALLDQQQHATREGE